MLDSNNCKVLVKRTRKLLLYIRKIMKPSEVLRKKFHTLAVFCFKNKTWETYY